MDHTSPTHSQQDGTSGRRFELKERLGKGAFGEVYLATQRSSAGFARKVALKVLHESRFGDDDATRRIRDEARVLGRLHHPNIVTVLDLVRLERQWAVVMEYVDGADLERIVSALAQAGRVFPAKAALELIAVVADALDAAYNERADGGKPLRVEHRDIKPANLRLTPNGDIKILDFGIARARGTDREASTGAYVIGTQRYMAPERIAGRGEGPSGDVYSLASTTFELLTGEPLGRSPVLSHRHQTWVRDRLVEALRPVLRADEPIHRRLGGLLSDCLEAEPLNRPRAADLAEEASRLARQLDGEGLRDFGRRFVPQVDALLGRQRDLVQGVLTERTTSSLPRTVDPSDTLRKHDETDPDEDEPGRAGWLPLIVAATTLAVVAVGVVILLIAGGLSVGAAVAFRMEEPDPGAPPEAAADPVAPAEPVTGAEPDPDPEPAPEPEKAASEPTPEPEKAAPKPAPRRTVTPRPEPEPEPTPVLSRALVTVDGAEGVRLVCGGVTATGTASARIMSFPAGTCDIFAMVDGREVEGEVRLTTPRAARCRVEGERLSCE